MSFSAKPFDVKCIKNIQTSAGENGPQTQDPIAPGFWPHLLSQRIRNETKELLDHHNPCKASCHSSGVCILRCNTKPPALRMAKMECVWDERNNLS